MDDLRHEIDLSAWRVDALPSTFADRVLARMAADDSLDDELDAMADELLVAHDDVAFLPPVETRARRHRFGRMQIAAIALGTAAALLVWLRPAPSRVDVEIAPAVVTAPAQPERPASAADLDRDGIRRAVRQQLTRKARDCDKALRRRAPDSEGRVTVQFGVIRDGDRGVVDHAEVLPDAEIQDEAFHRCLVEAMLEVVFDPPAKGRIVVAYPIVFQRP